MSKIARLLGVLAVAGTPFLLTAPHAVAAAGCAVDNASTTSSTTVTVTAPPPVVTIDSTSLSCSYVTGGGVVSLSCTLAGGLCQATRSDGTIGGTCVAYANTGCFATFTATAGDTITLKVYGGHGSVTDQV